MAAKSPWSCVGGKKAEMVRGSINRRAVAQALGISHKHLTKQSKLETKDEALKEDIEAVHKFHPAYGHRRLAWHLKVNHKRILRVMHKFGLKPPRRKIRGHYCTQTTSRQHPYTNLIKGLSVSFPHELWCSDVTTIADWYWLP